MWGVEGDEFTMNKNMLTHNLVRGFHLFIIAALLAGLALGLSPAPVAHAATITVNTTDDELNSDGDCSLRGLAPGATAVVTVTLPDNLPAGSQYWKYGPTAANPADHWYQIPMGDNDGDHVITITITDGGDGDDDLTANGSITEPGGPGQPQQQPPAPIGGVIVPVNKVGLIVSWLGLVVLTVVGAVVGGTLVL